jgi:UDP-glucose 4-epimerase
VDIQDAVDAHLLALDRAPALGFDRFIISATTPFVREDAAALHEDAPAVVARYVPEFEDEYARRGWRMLPRIERVYDNARARRDLGWSPRYDFHHALDRLERGEDPRCDLARAVGAKGYHAESTGPYTVR